MKEMENVKTLITSSWQLLTRDENINFLLCFVEISETVQLTVRKSIPTPETRTSQPRQTKGMGFFFPESGHAGPKERDHMLLVGQMLSLTSVHPSRAPHKCQAFSVSKEGPLTTQAGYQTPNAESLS